MTVLVATENTTGPARRVAESIVEALTEREIDATVGDLTDLERAEEFEGIVFGGEVSDGQLSPDARDALLSQASGLTQQLVWLFGADSTEDDDLSELVSEIAARGYKSFPGSAEPADVRSWASSIADEIDGHS